MPDVVVRFVTDTKQLDDSVKKLQQTGKLTEAQAKQWQEVGASIGRDVVQQMDKLNEATKKNTQASTEGFKSLKQQIAEAKKEAASFEDQNSKAAVNAQKRVANLIEKQDDLNKRVAALNPEAKFNAFNQVVQGATGGMQALTGALQVFGVKNEEVAKIAQGLQGALNLTGGLNSLLAMKDSLGNLKVALGLATVAEAEFTTATIAAQVALAAPVVGLAAAVAAVGFVIYKLTEPLYEEAEALEKATKAAEDHRKVLDETARGYLDVLDATEQLQAHESKMAELKGASELQILQLRAKQLESNIADLNIARNKANDAKLYAEIQNDITKALFEQEEVQQKILNVQRDIAFEASKIAADKIAILPPPQEIERQVSEAMDVVGRTITQKSSDIVTPFFTTKEQQEKKDDLEQFFQDTAALAENSFAFINELSSASTQQQVADLEYKKERGIISEQQYQKELKKIKTEQAQQQKLQALFEGAIQVALAILEASPDPARIALATTIGALQLGAIAARPIPKFKKGTLSVPGINTGGDSVFAMLQPGEAVIPTEMNKAFAPTISAIYKGMVTPKELNAFVRGKRESVEAHINPYSLKRGMTGVKMLVANADQIGEAVANRMGSSFSRLHERRIAN